jgi:hypothetical protein
VWLAGVKKGGKNGGRAKKGKTFWKGVGKFLELIG